MIARLSLIIVLSLGAAACSDMMDGDSRQAGMTAYRSRDFGKALRILGPLAEEGDPESQTILGNMYIGGKGVPQDFSRGLLWFRKAAKNGNGEAQLLVDSLVKLHVIEDDSACKSNGLIFGTCAYSACRMDLLKQRNPSNESSTVPGTINYETCRK
jgi:TPR repeat protein